MKRILLVEDDWALAGHWNRLLETAGYDVTHEAAANDAIAALETSPFDIVVTDLMLPGGAADEGGLDVISYVALSLNPRPEVLAVTGAEGRSSFVDRNLRHTLPLQALRKPVSDQKLLEAIAELGAPQVSKAAPPRPSAPALADDWRIVLDALPADSLARETLTARIRELEDAERARQAITHQNRAMLQLLSETDGVWDWRVNDDELLLTPGFRQLLGFPVEATAGLPDRLESFAARVHPDDQRDVWMKMNRGLAQGGVWEHEFRIRRMDGDYIWVRNRAATSLEDGAAVRVVGSMHDITEQRLAGRERDRLLDLAVQLFAFIDIDRKTWRRLSPGWSEVAGQPMEQLLSEPLLDRLHPQDSDEMLRRIDRAAHGAPSQEFLARVRGHDGDYRYVEWRIAPAEENERCLLATARDITDLDSQLLQTLARMAPEVLYIYDLEHERFVFRNRDFTESASLDRPTLGRHGGAAWNAAPPEDQERIRRHHERMRDIRDGEVVEFQFRLPDADGELRPYLARESPSQRGPDGGVRQVVGAVTQLDEFEVLQGYARDLEAANDELEQFAHVASHDLKQPLRGIAHLAAWIAEDAGDGLPDSAREHLNKMKVRVSRLERLLDDLLAFSRAGRLRTQPTRFRLDALVAEIAEISNAPPSYRIEYVGEIDWITTSRTELELILRNLIGNAVKHRSADNQQASVRAEVRDHVLDCRVADNGEGIAAEYHDRVFEVFQTLEPRDRVDGSGIGLALVRRLVEKRGGVIRLHSNTGEGCEVRFTWPLEIPVSG